MTRRQGLSSDDGVFAVLYGLIALLLVALCAYVVDISSLRTDRRDDRLAADAAASGGASDLGEFGSWYPQAACNTAWGLALANLGLPTTSGSISCANFPAGPVTEATCPGARQDVTGTGTGRYSITISWPVPDSDPLMTRPDDLVGTTTQPTVATAAGDGTSACERLGVTINAGRNLAFGGALGAGNGSTTSRSVAKFVLQPGSAQTAIPLVVLDKTVCTALETNGSTSIIVAANGDSPGRIAVDSDGSTSCNGQAKVITPSNNNNIYALDSATGGQAHIYSYALGVGNTAKAFDTSLACAAGVHGTAVTDFGSSSLCVRPEARATRVGRGTFDSTFGCLTSSGSCSVPSSTNYIQQYTSFARQTTAPAGFTVIPNNDPRCNSGTPSALTLFTGNYWIQCSTFNVTGFAAFATGNVIFKGAVNVQSGCLLFNQPAGVTFAQASSLCSSTTVPAQSVDPDQESVVYIEGAFSVAASGTSLYAPQTTVIQPSGNLTINNGSGHTVWTAPYGSATGGCTAGNSTTTLPSSACFKNLALWNDGTTPDSGSGVDSLKGGSAPAVDGAFFLPNARVFMNGNSTGAVTRAQLYAGRLTATGGGQLTLSPDPSRNIKEPFFSSGLIR